MAYVANSGNARSLNFNQISYAGAAAIGEALKTNATLRRLECVGCTCDRDGDNAFADA